MREKRLRIPPKQMQNARSLRKDATFPERILWSRLRAGRLAGLKFRRQVALGPYIVDFYCPAAALIIELDGRSHDGRQSEDRERTKFLEQLGLRVIRYFNDDVIGDVDAVAEAIAREAGWTGEGGTQGKDPPPAPP